MPVRLSIIRPVPTLGHVRDDGGTAMDLGDDAEIDGEREMHGRAFFQSRFSVSMKTPFALKLRARGTAYRDVRGQKRGRRFALYDVYGTSSLHAQLPDAIFSAVIMAEDARARVISPMTRRYVDLHRRFGTAQCRLQQYPPLFH